MKSRILVWLFAIAGIAVGCGDCGDDPENVGDAGTDAATVADAGNDATSNDSGTNNATTPDMAGDSGLATCGNGQLDEGEACDGTLFRDEPTCSELGLPDGTIACSDTCQVDTVGCAVCEDRICSDGETAVSCPFDCAVRSISAGRTHTCAALADGSLWCWGALEGHGMGGTPDTNVPVRIPLSPNNATQVSVGEHHTCFVRSHESIWCFGKNGFGEAGPAQAYNVFPPVKVMDGTLVEAGKHHTCGLDLDGDVLCWGRGDHGQRGDGSQTMRKALATPVTTQRNGTDALALGGHVSCEALGTSVRCWGDNARGQLPIGSLEWQDEPITVADLLQLQLYDVGVGEEHACYSVQFTYDTTQKILFCVGANGYGQLAVEASTDIASMDNEIVGNFSPVAAGYGYTCAEDNTTETPQLKCWGDNYFGQLGDGTTDTRHTIEPVDGIGEVTALSAGYDHVCAILPDGTARCWGRNREGQLGNGGDERSYSTPVSPLRMGPATDGGSR